MSAVEFTLDRGRSIIERLRESGYSFRAYDDEIAAGDVLLRHDVDLSPDRAVEMARIERDLGISATYFFLLSTPLYNPFEGRTREAIREIDRLGHDVGLHFSTHQHWSAERPPGEDELADRVHDEQAALATVAPDPVSIVSFHAPPDWVLDRTFAGFQSTYEPRFFEAIEYVADSGQRWREEGVRIPTDGRPLQVLMHPGLWAESDAPFAERVREAVAARRHRVGAYANGRYLDSGSVGRGAEEPPEA